MKRPPQLRWLLILGPLALLLVWLIHLAHQPQAPGPTLGLDASQLTGPSATGPALSQALRLNKSPSLRDQARAAREKILAGERQPDLARQTIAQNLLSKFTSLRERRASQVAPPLRGQPRGYGRTVFDPGQQQAIDTLLATLGADAEIQMDRVNGTVRYLEGDLSRVVADSPAYMAAQAVEDYSGMALATLQSVSRVMNIQDPSAEFVPQTPDRDELDMAHVKLDQTYAGLPVWGAQVIVHFNAAGQPSEIQGVYAPTPVRLPRPDREIDATTALAKAQEAVGFAGRGLPEPRVQRMIYWDPNRAPVLSYQVDLMTSLTEYWHVFVHAADGSLVHVSPGAFSAAVTGQSADLLGVTRPVKAWQEGNSILAIDTTLPMYDATRSRPPVYTNLFGAVCIFNVQDQDWEQAINTGIGYSASNNKDQWDPTVVSVMNHFATIYAYYKTTHNRNSFDDRGVSLTALIHSRFKNPSGQLYKDNAFFIPSMNIMVFGDGETSCNPGKLPAALDIAAHELTHGVVDNSAAFLYENQSGVLHEHMADYFACMVDRDDWYNGEDTLIGQDKIAWRDLSDPRNPQMKSPGPKTMAEYENLPNTPQGDNGGVHVNVGIPNYAAYLFTGGPQGLGRDKAEKIVYRALTKYLTKNAQFIDYRRALLSAARDLHPNGPEADVIAQAFDTVGIRDGQTAPPPTPVPPTTGNEMVLFERAEYDFFGFFLGYGLYYMDQQNFELVASQAVARTRPAVSGDGTWAIYVSEDNDVYWTDGTDEEAWTDTGDVRTIAMSKDLRYIAFTTTDYDNTITVIDVNSETWRTATLTIATSGDPVRVDYADVLTFNCLGDTLLFDAFSEGRIGQSEYGCWGLFGMRIKDLACWALLPLSPGMQVGNPSMAHTSPYELVADYIYSTNQQSTIGVVGLDLNQNRLSVLLKGLNTLAAPSFRGDDQKIVYELYENGLYYLYEAALAADRASLVANSASGQLWSVNELAYPVGFRSGTYNPPAGRLRTLPETLGFGEVALGQIRTNSLILTNAGNADLDLIEVTLEGPNVDAYDFGGAIQKRLAAGQGTALPLLFHPGKTGALPATLRLKSTVPGQADVVVQLTGTGTGAPTGNYWQQAWQDFQNHYSYFDLKGVNWSNIYTANLAAFNNLSPEQFAVKLNDVLQVLHDWHVAVRQPDGTWIGYQGNYTRNCSSRLYPTYLAGADYVDVKNAHVIYHAWLQNRLAHIVIDTLDTTAFNALSDADIEALFQTYADAAGLILDLRNNSGGNEANAVKFASRLLEAPTTFGYIRNRIANTVPYQFEPLTPKILTPFNGARFRKPVVGLVGQRCMSSAEWFTLMLKACPNTILIGDRTRGASGNPTQKTIPELNVTYQICTWIAFTEELKPIEDRGITPAITLPADQSYHDSLQRDYVLEQAIAYLRWRDQFGTGATPMSARTDTDRDGVRDLDEFWAGTHPGDPASRFGFKGSSLRVEPGGRVTLTWDSAAGKTYQLYRSTNLKAGFTLLAPNLSATPPLNTYTDTAASAPGPYYYKLEVLQK